MTAKAKSEEVPTVTPEVVHVDGGTVVVSAQLSKEQMLEATHLQKKAPKIVKAVEDMSKAENALREKYFELCRSIRETSVEVVKGQAVRTLNRKEVTLLLLSLGFKKQRVTEINRVVEVSDEIWKQYEAKTISFRATLQLARGSGEEGDTPPVEGDTGPDAGKVQPKLSKEVQTALAELMVENFDKLKSTKGKKPYFLEYVTANADGNEEKKFEISIKVTVQ